MLHERKNKVLYSLSFLSKSNEKVHTNSSGYHGISLPKELDSLVEEMSKNVHEVWAQTRIAQGWTVNHR